MAERRRFNRRERAALYLAADGYCKCGAELEAGWHADHVQPWSRDGKTDMVNGQALCPICNLKKGDKVSELRTWQQRALDLYVAAAKQDFLLEATPGAGKTRAAAAIARQLLDDGTIERVAVVVPTDTLREQWCDATAGWLRLRPLGDGVASKAGFDGVVASYQQLSRGTAADLLRHDAGRHRTLGIADEPHHAGRGRAFADGLLTAFGPAARRLLITGTPWRRDNRPIPYVTYGTDDMVHVDYHYRYAAAVNDRICRPVVFHAHNGEARWVDCGEFVEAHVCEDLDEEKTGAALDTLYRPDYEWMPAILAKAARSLDELREEISDAGGHIWAETRWHANAYAELLERITGERPALVHGEEDDPKLKIDQFRRGSQRWLVSVQMVSEGVDIPRLAVGVFAAKKTTPLFFRQAVGRLVRRTPAEEDFNAQLFMPAVPVLVRHAYEIEQELLHELAEERAQEERAQKENEERQRTLNFRVPLSASEPVYTESIHRGLGYEPTDLTEALAMCEKHSIRSDQAVNVARIIREIRGGSLEISGQVTVQPAAEAPHRREQRLRRQVHELTCRLDNQQGLEPGTTNIELLKAGFPKRKYATVEQLEEILKWLTARP